MPITLPCPRRPRPGPATRPLLDPSDALHVALFALGDGLGTVCLLLDHARHGVLCVVVDGAVTGEQVDDVGTMLVALGAPPPVAAAVLVTARSGPFAPPGHDDHLRFLLLREHLDEAGLDLVDWLVANGGWATSMAALTDAADRWPGS